MIRVIAFDLGGVLFAEGRSRLLKSLPEGYDPEVVNTLLLTPMQWKLKKGLITDHEFWKWAQQQLPDGYDAQFIKEQWYSSYVLDEDILQLIKNLRKRYIVVTISGNIKTRIEYLEKKYHFREYFEKEIYSFKYHFLKGSVELATKLLDETGVPAEEVVHIDDKEKSANGSAQLGIHTIIYSRGEITKLKDSLRKLGVSWE